MFEEFIHSETLRLLVVSDIHLAFSRVTDLIDWMGEHEDEVDLVIVAGDFANLSEEERLLPEAVAAVEGDITTILSALENITCRVIYIPGNHDPDSLLSLKDPLPRLTPHSVNVHGQMLRVAADLCVAGFGGSVSAYCDGQEFWTGYPYAEEDISQGMTALLKTGDSGAMFEKSGGDEDGPVTAGVDIDPVVLQDSILLLTHTGPWDVATTIDTENGPVKGTPLGSEECPATTPVQAGSTTVREILQTPEYANRIVANLHGHVHAASGSIQFHQVPVINPGSLQDGRFALVHLRRGGGGDGAGAATPTATTAAGQQEVVGGEQEEVKGTENNSSSSKRRCAWEVASVELCRLPETMGDVFNPAELMEPLSR